MGVKCFSIFTVLIAVAAYFIYQGVFAPVAAPNIDANKYWGPSALVNQVDKFDVKPFKIDYSADVIQKLRDRLREPLNLVEPLEGANFRYGFNEHKLEELIKYWRDNYLPRWNERQNFLNGLPQFTTKIQGFVIFYFQSLRLSLIHFCLLR